MSKKIGIPCEFKYKLFRTGWTTMNKGLMYEIREKYGAAEALEIFERFYKRDDRTKNLTNMLRTIFKIEGNDIEAINKWFNIWGELCEQEATTLGRSKTLWRYKITKCPWKTVYKDISDWCKIWCDIVVKTINPKATQERPIEMCAGDPYCEYVWKIEE